MDGHKENGKFHPHDNKPGIHSSTINHSSDSHPGSVKTGKTLHSNGSVKDYFDSLSSHEQYNMESNAGVEQENQIYNGGDKHDFDENLESTQKKLEVYFSKFSKADIDKATKSDTPYPGYPNEFSTEDFDDFFESKNVLKYVDDDVDKMDGSEMAHVEEDPVKRKNWVIDYAKKHNAQIYTLVDMDSGEVGYSKGVRFVNRIDQGNYVVVRKSNLVVDNS